MASLVPGTRPQRRAWGTPRVQGRTYRSHDGDRAADFVERSSGNLGRLVKHRAGWLDLVMRLQYKQGISVEDYFSDLAGKYLVALKLTAEPKNSTRSSVRKQ